MKVFIAGLDGGLGWSLPARGHEVGGADVHFRRKWVADVFIIVPSLDDR